MSYSRTVRLSALSLLALLSLGDVAFAVTPSVPRVYATDDTGMEYPSLYTESSWMALEVPLSVMGGMVPRDLSLAVSGLPDGTTITLGQVKTRGGLALVHLKVKRSEAARKTFVNSLATVEVRSGGQVLSTVAIPVLGVASDQ